MGPALVDRLQQVFWLAAEEVMFHHSNPWELDEALCHWGYETGPCEMQDHIGLDRVLARQPSRPVPVLGRMVAEGRLGKQGGVGYYRYPGGGGAVIDPLIEDLIREEAWFAGVPRSDVADDVLIDRMHVALAGAVAQLRAEGAEAAHLEAAARQGLGFPSGRSLGGLGG